MVDCYQATIYRIILSFSVWENVEEKKLLHFMRCFRNDLSIFSKNVELKKFLYLFFTFSPKKKKKSSHNIFFSSQYPQRFLRLAGDGILHPAWNGSYARLAFIGHFGKRVQVTSSHVSQTTFGSEARAIALSVPELIVVVYWCSSEHYQMLEGYF